MAPPLGPALSDEYAKILVMSLRGRCAWREAAQDPGQAAHTEKKLMHTHSPFVNFENNVIFSFKQIVVDC